MAERRAEEAKLAIEVIPTQEDGATSEHRAGRGHKAGSKKARGAAGKAAAAKVADIEVIQPDPAEDSEEETIICDLAYPVPRYHDDRSPMCLYIPSPSVLFKMMRACIGVEEVEELWMYNENQARKDNSLF